MKNKLIFLKKIGLTILSILLAFLGGTLINMFGGRYLSDSLIGSFLMQLVLGGLLPFISMSILGSRFKVEENVYHKIIFVFFIILFIGIFFLKLLSGYIPEMENLILGIIEACVPVGISIYLFLKYGNKFL